MARSIADFVPVYDPKARIATPKHEITPRVIAKEEKKKTKAKAEAEFRAAIWARDKHRCRATGKPVQRSGTDAKAVGEIHHRLQRSTNPDRVLDPTIGVLLSRYAHQLAETPCPGDPSHYLLDIEGPEDMALPHVFIFRDRDGKELRRRTS